MEKQIPSQINTRTILTKMLQFHTMWTDRKITIFVKEYEDKCSRIPKEQPHPAAPNLHTCVHKEIRNGVEFCHYHEQEHNP